MAANGGGAGLMPNAAGVVNPQNQITIQPAVSYPQGQNLMGFNSRRAERRNRLRIRSAECRRIAERDGDRANKDGATANTAAGGQPTGSAGSATNPTMGTNPNFPQGQRTASWGRRHIGHRVLGNGGIPQSSDRFGLARPQGLGTPIERPDFGRSGWQQFQSEPQSYPAFALSPATGQ